MCENANCRSRNGLYAGACARMQIGAQRPLCRRCVNQLRHSDRAAGPPPRECQWWRLLPAHSFDSGDHTGYVSGYRTKAHDEQSGTKRAMESYRARMTQRGRKRFEVLAPETDRELIRSLARQLAEAGPNSEQTRQRIKALVSGEPAKAGNSVGRRSSGLISICRAHARTRSVAPTREGATGRSAMHCLNDTGICLTSPPNPKTACRSPRRNCTHR